MGIANPVTTPNTGNRWLDSIMWGTQWDSGADAGEQTEIYVYLAGTAGVETISLDDDTVVASSPLYLQEIQAMVGAMQAYMNVCNVSFASVRSANAADIIWASVDDADADGALGWANPPGTGYNSDIGDHQSIVAINYDAYDPAGGEPNLLISGGYDFITYVHELGHALGLAHPHDDGGGSLIAPGVTERFGDLGDFDLNQGIFSVMSYNDGWLTGPLGVSTSTVFGFQIGPMAFDIAAVQRMYGANMSYHAGNDVYALPTANRPGTGYVCIWDAGGTDRIVGGDFGNVIDLRSATLQVAAGGGGYVSYANGIHGGFTIANGALIENATGGAGVDLLRGNGAANSLIGLGGADKIYAFGGNDVVEGGDGDDNLYGGLGADRLIGGTGFDYVRYDDAAYGNLVVNLATPAANTGAAAGDIFSGIEGVIAGAGNDRATGDAGANRLFGLGGNDTLDGGTGSDLLYGGFGNDIFYVDGAGDRVFEVAGAGTDTVVARTSYTLQAGQAIDKLMTISSAATTAISLAGNELAQVIQGNNGTNVLYGRAGADALIGLGGADTFVFDTALGATNVDRITDFSSAADTIRLDKTIFAALNLGVLGSAAYKDIGDPGAVVDANDRILYNDDTGRLFYDRDGSGAAASVWFAVLDTKPATLSAADFFVVA